ncbi:MAG TPA: peptidoglycan editing factor PgeF [Dehalococcoidia bacterium]|nr:peptidoglycan editing factor PgeF [Dehalococcoidia bacterium]
MRVDRDARLVCLRFPLLETVPGVRHAVTTRLGGHSSGPYAAANLGLAVGDEHEAVLANRELAATLVAPGAHPATVKQVHGVAAALAEAPGVPGVPLCEADMLVTRRPGVPLLVQAADCVPIVLIDPETPAAAVVHAGWCGTAAGAGREAVATLQRLCGSRPNRLLAGVGPAIGVCCYEVGDDVADAVAAASGGATGIVDRSHGERPHLSLEAALRRQLLAAGLPDSRIVTAGLCTACRLDLFYSHRREGTPTGRFGALVALTATP